jgi:hypothetical protein
MDNDAAQRILANQPHFYLSPEKWDEFCSALDAPPSELPELRKLLNQPSIFDKRFNSLTPLTRSTDLAGVAQTSVCAFGKKTDE